MGRCVWLGVSEAWPWGRFDEVEHVVEVGLGVRRRLQTSL
jgi:hypothetical protein